MVGGDAATEISHTPRPCVPARRTRLAFCSARSKTAERGRPVPNGVQLAPPSVELYTPMSVPAKMLLEFAGSITSALIGMLGMPLPAAVHTAATGDALQAAPRIVIFQTP